MNGCRAKDGFRCDDFESDRIKMNIGQPKSMVNYTDTGFKKIRAPKALYDLLRNHWDTNRENMKEEVWAKGNSYVNHWANP
jgi:prolyl 4-hydroxylase